MGTEMRNPYETQKLVGVEFDGVEFDCSNMRGDPEARFDASRLLALVEEDAVAIYKRRETAEEKEFEFHGMMKTEIRRERTGLLISPSGTMRGENNNV